MTERLRVREIDDDEGRRLVRIAGRARALRPFGAGWSGRRATRVLIVSTAAGTEG